MVASEDNQSSSKGFILYSAAIFMLAVTDASAKWLTQGYPIGELVFFRAIFSFIPLFLVKSPQKNKFTLSSKKWYFHILRGFVVVLTAVTFFISVKHLPLANATVISLSNPFFMTLLGAVLLNEKVNISHWMVILVGFCGVIISVGGLSSSSIFYTLIGVLSALFYATGGIITRFLSKTETALMIALYTNISLLIFSIFLFNYEWHAPNIHDFLIFLIMGLTGGLSNYIATLALRYADVSKVAPIEYTIIIWAALFGVVVFNEIPSAYTIAGAILIILGGILHMRLGRSR